MNETTLRDLKDLIQRADNIGGSYKKAVIASLDRIASFDENLGLNKDLQELFADLKDFINTKDNYSLGDKLLSDYGLSLSATIDEIEEKRKEEISNLERKLKSCRYLDRAKEIKRKINSTNIEFDLMIENIKRRTLSGDLKEQDTKDNKAIALMELEKLVDGILEFTDESKEVVEEERVNYNYKEMSDEEIAKAQEEINETPLKTSENTHDYLEPIEYFANTNVKKPRNQGVYESNEDYQAFLQEYYSRYDFTNTQPTSKDESADFYQGKIDYSKNKVKEYFDKLRESLSDLRWVYNFSLTEIDNLNNDIDSYDRDNTEESKKYKEEAEKDISMHESFIKMYESKLKRINEITSKLFNEPPVKGDIVVSVEFEAKDGKLQSNIVPLLSIIEEELRKKYANFDANKQVDEEYEFDLNTVTKDDINDMIGSFIDSVTEQLSERDYEEIVSGNIEVVIDGKVTVMPIHGCGVSIKRLLNNAYGLTKVNDNDKVLTKKFTNNYNDMSRSDLEARLKEIESEMAYRTHEENGMEGHEDDNLLDEYKEIKEALKNAPKAPLMEVDVEEPELSIVYGQDKTKEDNDADKTKEDNGSDKAKEDNGTDKELIYGTDVSDKFDEDKVKQAVENLENPPKDIDMIYGVDNSSKYSEDMVDNIINATNDTVLRQETEENIVEANDEAETDKELDSSLKETDTKEKDLILPPELPIGIEQKPEFDKKDEEVNDLVKQIEDEQPEEEQGKEEDTNDEKVFRVVSTRPLTIKEKIPSILTNVASLALWGVTGTAMYNFGASRNTSIFAAGFAAIASFYAMNIDDIKHAATKWKLKRMASKYKIKLFFGDDDKIIARTKDGLELDEETKEKFQKELDDFFDISDRNEKGLPLVTVDTLTNAFIYNKKNKVDAVNPDLDQADYYVASDKEIAAYNKVKDISAFESYGNHDWLDDKDKEEDKASELERLRKEKEALLKESSKLDKIASFDDLKAELIRLNPGIEKYIKYDGNEDAPEFFIHGADPEKIKLPEGFEYANSYITNINSTNGSPISISVMKDEPDIEIDPIETIIADYGDKLLANEEELKELARIDGKHSLEEFEQAAERYSTEVIKTWRNR